MTVFIIAILVLLLLALAFVVPVMLRRHTLEADSRDQLNIRIAKERLAELRQERDVGNISEQDFNQVRDELEKNLALDLAQGEVAQMDATQHVSSSKPMAVFLVLAVPVLAGLIYWQIGAYQLVDAQPPAPEQAQQQQHAPQMSIEEAVAKLEQRLQQEPDNVEGWFMLARTYAAMSQYDKAVTAYQEVLKREGETDANLLLRYVDALAMTRQGRFDGEPLQYLQKALSLDPHHPQGLWMMGMAQAQQGNMEQALLNWYQVLPQLEDERALSQLNQMIADAEQQLDKGTLQRVRESKPQTMMPVADSGAQIQVTVSLDDALRDKVSADDTVFIFARAVSGPPMPLAAVKQRVADLPVTVVLNDAMAMMPAMKLSQYPQVTVGAKISKSGTAGPAAGDLFGEVSPVNVADAGAVNVVINQVR